MGPEVNEDHRELDRGLEVLGASDGVAMGFAFVGGPKERLVPSVKRLPVEIAMRRSGHVNAQIA